LPEAQVARYVVVPEHSEVAVDADSTLHAIHGRAARATGEIDIGVDGRIVEGRLEVEVRDLSWGNPLLDRETRRRIDERTHPSITGTIVADECIGEGVHRSRGTIAFLGATHDVSGELHVEEGAPGTLVVTGEQRFDVRDWGLQPPRLLALKVHPEITVRIRLRCEPLRT
jgi:hypothetical protein